MRPITPLSVLALCAAACAGEWPVQPPIPPEPQGGLVGRVVSPAGPLSHAAIVDSRQRLTAFDGRGLSDEKTVDSNAVAETLDAGDWTIATTSRPPRRVAPPANVAPAADVVSPTDVDYSDQGKRFRWEPTP